MKFIKTMLAKQLEQALSIGFTPRRATPGSSGYDLRACIEAPITLHPDQVEKIPTGVKVWIDSEVELSQEFSDGSAGTFMGLLFPRSSTAGAILNNTIGVVDSDYQGEIFIKLRNITAESITITPGEAFAQLIITPTYLPILTEVDNFEYNTARGDGGFGSTSRHQDDLLGR